MIINREFYVHWVDDILNRQVTFRDPAGNFHNCWVRNHVNIGLFTDGVRQMAQFYGLDKTHFVHFRYNGNRSFDIQIMDSNSVEVEYPILHNEPPAIVVPPAPNAAADAQHDVVVPPPPNAAVDAQHVVVVPPPPNAAPNAQPAQNQNIENADVVGWTVKLQQHLFLGIILCLFLLMLWKLCLNVVSDGWTFWVMVDFVCVQVFEEE
ncbi:DNA-binding barrel domain superfamily [Sesbania bispinosa]|nr:DNA-binding barrel domain superfamily [Sesbania bispinosa]